MPPVSLSLLPPTGHYDIMPGMTNFLTPEAPSAPAAMADGGMLVPLPSAPLPTLTRSSSLTPVLVDQRAIGRLLATLLSRAHLSVGEASRRLGVSPSTLRQYIHGRRTRPSLAWFVRLADLCGAKLTVEYPR